MVHAVLEESILGIIEIVIIVSPMDHDSLRMISIPQEKTLLPRDTISLGMFPFKPI